MRISPATILLIGVSEESNDILVSTIRKLGFKVIFANNIEIVIQRSLKDVPDMIICYYQLQDLNGFQVYNILNNEILKNEIPFVMVFDQFRKNDLYVAVELGIDSFIFPPYDTERISNIIKKQLAKTTERTSAGVIKFDSVCKVIPYGIFVANDRVIVETNETFDKLVSNTTKVNGKYLLREVFEFNHGNEDELKLSRFMNGLTKDCCFNEIRVKGDDSKRYNLYFSLVKNRGSSSKVVGVIMPIKEQADLGLNHGKPGKTNEELGEFLDPNLITARERQVLELSATGIPIKQIASRLGISERTVEKHRSNIIQKTNSENIMEAVFMYGKNHMLSTY